MDYLRITQPKQIYAYYKNKLLTHFGTFLKKNWLENVSNLNALCNSGKGVKGFKMIMIPFLGGWIFQF